MSIPDYYHIDLGSGVRTDAIEVIEALSLNFSLGCVIKYIVRHGRKASWNGTEDLQKAAECLRREVERRVSAGLTVDDNGEGASCTIRDDELDDWCNGSGDNLDLCARELRACRAALKLIWEDPNFDLEEYEADAKRCNKYPDCPCSESVALVEAVRACLP